MHTLFFRLLSHRDKAAALSEAMGAIREAHTLNPVVHTVDPASFRQVPGSPFAYWASERIRKKFLERNRSGGNIAVISMTYRSTISKFWPFWRNWKAQRIVFKMVMLGERLQDFKRRGIVEVTVV